SAVDRVSSLPLLSSALDLVSSAYSHTKESHPCLGGVCSVAETVAAVAVGSVLGGAQPLLGQLQPQIALVNEYACKGLDQLEENLPFLQQPADKVRKGAKELVANKVTDAVDKVTKAVDGAKELVANKVTEAVDLTKGAVQDSVEKTKSVVASTVSTALDAAYGTITSKINTALEQGREALQEGVEMTNSVVASSISKAKEVSQAVAGGVESVLGMSEDLVDHYLPMTEEELGKLAAVAQGGAVAPLEEQRRRRGYFVRLGSLPARLRRPAQQHALAGLQALSHSTRGALARLQLAMQLIESVKQEVGQKLLEGQQKLHQLWVDWSLTQPKGNQVRTACQPEVEPRTLAMLRILTQQLQPAYESLGPRTQGLPCSIQHAVSRATRHIHELHSSFSRALSFQDLSRSTLARCQDRVAEARRCLDVLLEFVTHNTPLNWVVGPFRAMARGAQDSREHE
ncbi:PLIN3 protein, partial [Erithacus rubecula]|nr:PLIN3 protein [Erithacus rubecula]